MIAWRRWCLLLGVALLTPATATAQVVDFSTFTVENFPATDTFAMPNWVVSGAGNNTAGETTNSWPTVFYSPQTILNTRITGTITPGTDDDLFGLVFGFNPGDANNAAANYLILDWKRVTQTFDFNDPAGATAFHGLTGSTTANMGLTLSRAMGRPNADELWGHVDLAENAAGGLAELGRGMTLGDTGYSTTGSHSFVIDYTPTNVRITVDGVLQFNVNGTFGNGRFGLYELSQSPGATFSDFSLAPVPEPSALLLGGLGLAGLGGAWWRRRYSVGFMRWS
jgi:hypothetical protein